MRKVNLTQLVRTYDWKNKNLTIREMKRLRNKESKEFSCYIYKIVKNIDAYSPE
jgi:hypothetical protein